MKLQSARIVCVGKYSIANTYSYKKYPNNYSNPDVLVQEYYYNILRIKNFHDGEQNLATYFI